jgi:predicted esterase
MNKTSTGTLLLLCVIGTLTNAYKPILIMHGLGGDFAGYEFLVEYLKQQRPNTPVIFLGIITLRCF